MYAYATTPDLVIITISTFMLVLVAMYATRTR